MKKYKVIYADPPWSYYNDMTVTPEKNKSGKGSISKISYPVMSSSDIKKMPINDITMDDAILFIWTTDFHLAKCCEVIKAWGFEYKTIGFVWQKFNKNNQPVCFMGADTLKSGVELCLIGTKGKKPSSLILNHKVRSLVQTQRGKHSKKPDEVRERIVEL